MSESQVMRFEEIETVDRGGGVTTKPLVGAWMGADTFSSGITSFPPGKSIRVHTHNVDESVTILEGEARCDIEGQSYHLKRLDTTFVPAGVAHRFVNESDGIMRILWTYSATHVTRTFSDTGETVEHLSGGDLAAGR